LLPGKHDTDRLRGAFDKGVGEAEAKARMAADIPAKRLGTAEEFGQICAFFCSIHAGYLTGQNIPVDGGLYTSAF
jgi:3-oxoacyl-[acyl-carrier protein] reductase